MKKIIKVFFLLFIITIMPIAVVKAQDKIILIDPGHGGQDGGAMNKNGLMEKDINLKIGLMTKSALEASGYKVFMTREEDVSLHTTESTVRSEKIQDLNARCQLKKESNCDVFISIHLNHFPSSSVKGPQVWHASNEQSKALAEIIQNTVESKLEITKHRVPKNAKNDYKILRQPEDRAEVIVECGFLSNEDEASKLNTEEYQNNIAESIKLSIDQYYKDKSH